jgi:hypothetical protein
VNAGCDQVLGVEHVDCRSVVAFKELEELSGDGSLQASPDVAGALALGPAAGGIGAGLGSSRSRATTTVWSARLSWRSPDRFSRCLVTWPEDAGMGLALEALGGRPQRPDGHAVLQRPGRPGSEPRAAQRMRYDQPHLNRADHTGSQPGSTDRTWLKTWWGSHRAFTSWSFL